MLGHSFLVLGSHFLMRFSELIQHLPMPNDTASVVGTLFFILLVLTQLQDMPANFAASHCIPLTD